MGEFPLWRGSRAGGLSCEGRHDACREQLDRAGHLGMTHATETEQANQAVRSCRFDHPPRLPCDRFGAADERGPPFLDPLQGKTSREIGESLGEPGEIVRRDRLAAPDVVGGQLPEPRDLRGGLHPRLLVAIGDIDLPDHDRVSAAGRVSESCSLRPIGCDGARAVGEGLAREG